MNKEELLNQNAEFQSGYNQAFDEYNRDWCHVFHKKEDQIKNLEKQLKAIKLITCKRCKKKVDEFIKYQELMK